MHFFSHMRDKNIIMTFANATVGAIVLTYWAISAS